MLLDASLKIADVLNKFSAVREVFGFTHHKTNQMKRFMSQPGFPIPHDMVQAFLVCGNFMNKRSDLSAEDAIHVGLGLKPGISSLSKVRDEHINFSVTFEPRSYLPSPPLPSNNLGRRDLCSLPGPLHPNHYNNNLEDDVHG